MIARILNIAWKELLHLRKDRLLIPFFILGGLGEISLIAWATGQPIHNINMTIVDFDKSEQSAALIQALDEIETLEYLHNAESMDDVYDRMSKVNTLIAPDVSSAIAVIIPENFGENLVAGERPTIQLVLNGAESVNSLEAQRAATHLIYEQGMREVFNMEPEDYADQLPQITVRYNEELSRGWYTLPAESALMFYMFTVVLAALTITREREKGTYEQLLVMPFRSFEVILGKALAPILLGYSLFLCMMGLTVFVFDVPFRGSAPLLFILAVVYLLAEVGKGVFVSMFSRTQLQGVLLVFVVVMVDFIFSGYAVAVETMPRFIQFLANFIPIRHWLIIVRGVMLKDVGLDVLWPNLLAIIVIGTVIIAVTASQYRRHVA